MTAPGQLRRRVQFRRRAADSNGSYTGAWQTVVTRDARVQPKFGGEAVQAARMAGQLPVNITIRRNAETEVIDNSFEARDARDTSIVWDITGATISEDRVWIEVLATQRLTGSDDE